VKERLKNKVKHGAIVAWQLARGATDEFSRDRGELAAGALSFYAMLSIAPLIIIAVAIAGIVLGREAARHEIQRLLTEAMGPQLASVVDTWVEQASSGGGIASVVGAALLSLAASRFATALKVALNQVWNVDVDLEESFKATLTTYVRRRAFAFLLVLTSGPLLLAVFVSRAVISSLGDVLSQGTVVGSFLLGTSQFLFSLLVFGAGCTLVFRFVPDTRVGWRVSAIGGLVTSILFNVGNLLVGFYLSRADVGAAYGIASSVAIALLWFYYSAMIFVFGAEFTQVWAVRFGRGLSPEEERDRQRNLQEAEAKRHQAEADGCEEQGDSDDDQDNTRKRRVAHQSS